MKKFKVSYFILQDDTSTGKTTKSELPVMQFISFITPKALPPVKEIESVINANLLNHSYSELDCYSPA